MKCPWQSQDQSIYCEKDAIYPFLHCIDHIYQSGFLPADANPSHSLQGSHILHDVEQLINELAEQKQIVKELREENKRLTDGLGQLLG